MLAPAKIIINDITICCFPWQLIIHYVVTWPWSKAEHILKALCERTEITPSQLATWGSRSFSANIEHSGMVNCSSCTITVVTTVTGDIAGVGYLTLKGEPKRRWMLAWKHRQCANTFISIFHLIALSMVIYLLIKWKKRSTFLLWDPQGETMLVSSLPGEWQKYHVFDAFATHAGCIHDITRADCWTQNGSVNRCVFMIYQQMSVFNKWDEKLSEKTSGGTFTIPFLSISPVTLFGFGSPLSPANHTCCIRVTQHSNQNSQHILKKYTKSKNKK